MVSAFTTTFATASGGPPNRLSGPAYASLVQAGLSSGSLAAALAGPHRLAQSLDDLWHALRVSLFDDALQDYFWQYDNRGLRLLQLRFYPIASSL